jgi:hypothetical protein
MGKHEAREKAWDLHGPRSPLRRVAETPDDVDLPEFTGAQFPEEVRCARWISSTPENYRERRMYEARVVSRR